MRLPMQHEILEGRDLKTTIACNSIATLVAVCLFSTVANAAPAPLTPGAPEAGVATLIYDAAYGNMSFDTGGLGVTTLEIRSASGLFMPSNIAPGIITPPFDVITNEKLFKLSTSNISEHQLWEHSACWAERAMLVS